MADPAEWVVVGKVGASHGLDGWFKIFSYTDPVTNIGDYDSWHLGAKQPEQAYTLSGFKPHGKNLLAKLDGVDDCDAAKLLTNLMVYVKAADLPKLARDEIYWHDLIGMEVINRQNESLGKITEIFSTGANDIIAVKSADNKEILIPYIMKHYVLKIDEKKREVKVDWERDF